MMKKRIITSLLFLGLTVTGIQAQRPMDVLDRGLVAQVTSSGVFVSWRINVEEWYDVKYNLYRDGTKLNAEPLNVSNFTDTGGTQTSKYTVKTVVDGVEQNDACPAVSPFADGKPYLRIVLPPVLNPMRPKAGEKQIDVTNLFQPNDCSAADLTGDGRYELILKRENNDKSIAGDTACTRFEVYKMTGEKMWEVDCGPNMVSLSNVETNMIAADYDGDGKAEVVCRLGEGAVLNDGTILGPQPIRHLRSGTDYQQQGLEYLVLLDGETGRLLDYMEYPLVRGDIAIWGKAGDGGHRANKFFFGAPYLNGRTPSLFISRGIYHRIEMAAYDIVNKKFVELWKNPDPRFQTEGTGYYACGFHNYAIADVDFDGRDEIVYGDAVADHDGIGLSTNFFGHGDAQHVGDLDPFRKGLEQFVCNESNPGTTLWDPLTGNILWRTTAGSDVGRCIAGNITDEFDGYALYGNDHFASATEKVTDPNCPDQVKHGSFAQNYALYWKGNLLQSTFNYGSFDDAAGYGVRPTIYDYEDESKNVVLEGTLTCNHTKGTPCMQIDIFGDWREELIVRSADNRELRIYTTDIPTPYRVYTLLGDKQYKNSIVWQMCGYNQPPHVSFFLGQREGITVPPPPETTNGREERTTSITSADNGKHVILCQMEGGTTAVNGATPKILTVNSPKDYTLTGALSGKTRLVKQGWGALNLSGEQTHEGLTDFWEGTVNLNGSITKSAVWMNRFVEMNLMGNIGESLTQEFGSILRIAGDDNYGTANIGSLTLKRGAILKMDLNSDGTATDANDKLNVKTLNIVDGAILHVIQHNLDGGRKPAAGEYLLMSYEQLNGNVEQLKLEGLSGLGATIIARDNALYVKVPVTRAESSTLNWNGNYSNVWDVYNTPNFYNYGSDDRFIADDAIVFDDYANVFDVQIGTSVEPASVTFDNSINDYTLSGDSIVGNGSLTKEGTAMASILNTNRYRGGTFVNGGTLTISAFGNTDGVEYGSVGRYDTPITLRHGSTLSTISNTLTSDQPVYLGEGGGVVNLPEGATVTFRNNFMPEDKKEVLTKEGTGRMTISAYNNLRKLVVKAGNVTSKETSDNLIAVADTLLLAGGNYYDAAGMNSYTKSYQLIMAEEGTESRWYFDPRCDYYGKLLGKGTLSVYAAGPRNYTYGDWSGFEGTVKIGRSQRGTDYDAEFTWDNNYGIPKGTMSIYNGTTVKAGSRNIELGDLTGTGGIQTTGRITLGGLNKNVTFEGTFSGCAVTKVGDGIWEVKKAISGLQDMQVKGGELRISNTSAIDPLLGDIHVTVSDSGAVLGRGYLYSMEVKSGTSITPGNYASTTSQTGEMKFRSYLTCEAGSTANFFVANKNGRSSQSARFTVEGKLTINGTINVTLKSSYNPAAGDSIMIWSAQSFEGTPEAINLPALPTGLRWNTDELLTTSGKLRIEADPTAIERIDATETADADIYTATGVWAGQLTDVVVGRIQGELNKRKLPAGTYIVRMRSGNRQATQKIIVK